MQKVKKSKKVEEPEQMQEPGKRKRKEVESSKAIAKAGKASKQSKKKDEEDAAVAAAKKKKSKKPVESDSDSSDSSDSDSSSSSSSESDSDSDSESDEQIAPETPKASTDDAQEASDGDASVDENHVSNFNLSKEVCAQLETKGITSLYSIQAQCFQPILDGKDLVGRARTGCGKTLAFVLPIVEHLGYDPVWWGIINVVVVELGMITPPIGMNVFVLHSVAPGVPLSGIFRGVTPFVLSDTARLRRNPRPGCCSETAGSPHTRAPRCGADRALKGGGSTGDLPSRIREGLPAASCLPPDQADLEYTATNGGPQEIEA